MLQNNNSTVSTSGPIVVDEEATTFLNENNVGTARLRTLSSTSAKKPVRKYSSNRRPSGRGRSKRNTNTTHVPLDLSNYSNPSRLDIVLPEFIVDHVEAFSNNRSSIDEVIQSEEERASAHQELEKKIKDAMEAMKLLEESYKQLYEQIDQARNLFPASDPTRKSLDDILTSATIPKDILKDDQVLSERWNDSSLTPAYAGS